MHKRLSVGTYRFTDFVIPPGEEKYHFSEDEEVKEGVLDPGGTLLHVEDVENKNPSDHNVVDEFR